MRPSLQQGRSYDSGTGAANSAADLPTPSPGAGGGPVGLVPQLGGVGARVGARVGAYVGARVGAYVGARTRHFDIGTLPGNVTIGLVIVIRHFV